MTLWIITIKVRELSHGTIIHGIQFLAPRMRNQPTTYYARNSGIGLTWRALESTGPLRMGVDRTWHRYARRVRTRRAMSCGFMTSILPLSRLPEINLLFSPDCPAHIDVVLGDARLSMEREPTQQFDILVIDAFSGDAIPIHLLTREAFRLYWRHLKADGVLAVHISNRYLNLAPVVFVGGARSSGSRPGTWRAMTTMRSEIYQLELCAGDEPSQFLPELAVQRPALEDRRAGSFPRLDG